MSDRPLLITGANGNLGRRLIHAALPRGPVRALVRSDRAARRLRDEFGAAAPGLDVRQVDYLDSEQMMDAVAGCRAGVHLVGIIKESAASTYADSHERTTAVLCDAIRAAGGFDTLVYLSIVGADPASANACLASKGRAERLIVDGVARGVVFQVPMVLGEGDYASSALRGRAGRSIALLLRGSSLEQPIYAGDVVDAVLAALDPGALDAGVYALAGPESLSRAELTRRAALLLGHRIRTVSIPLWIGLLMARVLEWSANPPVTRAMLGVLDHDDAVDPSPVLSALDIELTPLDETPERALGSPSAQRTAR